MRHIHERRQTWSSKLPKMGMGWYLLWDRNCQRENDDGSEERKGLIPTSSRGIICPVMDMNNQHRYIDRGTVAAHSQCDGIRRI